MKGVLVYLVPILQHLPYKSTVNRGTRGVEMTEISFVHLFSLASSKE